MSRNGLIVATNPDDGERHLDVSPASGRGRGMSTICAPEWPYIRLRAALTLFGKPPAELSSEQLHKAEKHAEREFEIESRILYAKEAACAVVPDEEIDLAVAEVRKRYQSPEAYQASLSANGLDESALRSAVARQRRVAAVLDRAISGQDEVSEVDIGIYYHVHFETFRQPERREAFHILISLNESIAENTRTQALARIQYLAGRLAKRPWLFSELARKHSECPTALQGGRIGLVCRGRLYPQLDAALFTLKTGRISPVLESRMGFHLLLCKTIRPPETLSLKQATPHIRKVLAERTADWNRRRWIASLPALTQE